VLIPEQQVEREARQRGPKEKNWQATTTRRRLVHGEPRAKYSAHSLEHAHLQGAGAKGHAQVTLTVYWKRTGPEREDSRRVRAAESVGAGAARARDAFALT
jgi:hypothetical protein